MWGLVWFILVVLFKFGCKNFEFFFIIELKKKVSVILFRRKIDEWWIYVIKYLYIFWVLF